MASFYYFNVALDNDLGNLLNYKTSDSSGGTPAGAVPGAMDDLFIGTGVVNADMPTNNTLTPVTSVNLFNSASAATGTSFSNSVTLAITAVDVVIGVLGDNTSVHDFAGHVTGNVTTQGGARYFPKDTDVLGDVSMVGVSEMNLTSSTSVTVGAITSSAATTIGFASATLTITSPSTIHGTFIGTNLVLNTTLAAIGATFGTNTDLTLTGNGTVTFTGSSTIGGSSGNAIFTDNTNVVVSGTPTIGGLRVNTAGNLTVNNAITVPSSVTITTVADATFNNTSTLNTNLTCTGTATFASGTTITDASVTAGGTITMTGTAVAATANHTLTVGTGYLTATNCSFTTSGSAPVIALVASMGGVALESCTFTYGGGGTLTVSASGGTVNLKGTTQLVAAAVTCNSIGIFDTAKMVDVAVLTASGTFSDTASGGGGGPTPQINSPLIRSLCGGKGK